MINTNGEILAFHDERVTLPQSERTTMKERRDRNRRRLKKALERRDRDLPAFHSQGSYAMKTMLQHPLRDYDIDDGVYFQAADLVGPRGGTLSSLEARQLVRDAIDDGAFKTPPEIRKNCVRVQYDAGYHVDLPVYRILEREGIFGKFEVIELASSDWIRSDARRVNSWFDERNQILSPDQDNGRQMRRIVRLMKRVARSRDSWNGSILSGFGITLLIAGNETQGPCFRAHPDRDDLSLLNTLQAIRERLEHDLVVKHPCTPDSTITKGTDDPKARFLRDKLDQALEWLSPLNKPECSAREARKAWGKVFYTQFFEERAEKQVSLARRGPVYPRPGAGLGFGSADADAVTVKRPHRPTVATARRPATVLPIPRLAPPHRRPPPWPVALSNAVAIERCVAAVKGFRPISYEDGGNPLAKHAHLTFEASTDVDRPFKVYWQVVNTGVEAERANGLRGSFDDGELVQGKLTRKENTLYRGLHSIECFIVKNGVLLAASGQFIVMIE